MMPGEDASAGPEPIRFGISGLPPDDDHASFFDRLAAQGHGAFELAFTKGFPWKERRCRAFGELAAERGIELSVHAPYFAVLTVDDDDRAKQCLAAVEHTMKLGRALGARVICVHPGPIGDRPAEEVLDLIHRRLRRLAPKVEDLGVGLGLETSGTVSSFGTLGDIALLCGEHRFVRPVVDWAHLHARTGGGLTSTEAFTAVLGFLRDQFPAWMIDPLQAQFTDNQVGPKGEVRHLPYREGTLRVGPLIEAVLAEGMSMNLISEAKEQESHEAIWEEIRSTLAAVPGDDGARPLGSGRHRFPGQLRAVRRAGRFEVRGVERPLTVSNLDKPFFPDGTTKGDLIQYYASVAPVLVPHLEDRPLSMSRYPDGIEGESFYEKRAPGHRPEWMPTAVVPSESMGGEATFVCADRPEALMWLAAMGCVEQHPFHSRVGSLDRPDYAIFDLDPAEGATWSQVVTATRLVGEALGRLGLEGYPKLSGSRGMHVYVPLEPVHDYGRVRRFVEAVGRLLVQADPDDLTMAWDIPQRRGKVFIDHNRNASGQTIASVYSVRPRPGAPVSAPIRWDEVGSLRNGDVTIGTLWDRLQRHGDLFAPVLAGSQTLDPAEAALGLRTQG